MTYTVLNINNSTEYWKINLRKSSKGQNVKKEKKKKNLPRDKYLYVKRSTTSKIRTGASGGRATETRNKENRKIKMIKILVEKNSLEQKKHAYSGQEYPVNAKQNK